MLYPKRIDPDKNFLRALMTNFFASSPAAHMHLAQVEAFNASAGGCKESHFKTLWSKAAQVGPLPQKTLNDLSQHASAASAKWYDSYFARNWDKVVNVEQVGPQPENVIKKIAAQATIEHKRDLNNAKGLFFAHLVEFVRNIKIPTSKFTKLPDTSDAKILKDVVNSQFGNLVRELQGNAEIQNRILSEFTPAQMDKPPVQVSPAAPVAEPVSQIELIREILPPGISYTPQEAAPQGLRLH